MIGHDFFRTVSTLSVLYHLTVENDTWHMEYTGVELLLCISSKDRVETVRKKSRPIIPRGRSLIFYSTFSHQTFRYCSFLLYSLNNEEVLDITCSEVNYNYYSKQRYRPALHT